MFRLTECPNRQDVQTVLLANLPPKEDRVLDYSAFLFSPPDSLSRPRRTVFTRAIEGRELHWQDSHLQRIISSDIYAAPACQRENERLLFNSHGQPLWLGKSSLLCSKNFRSQSHHYQAHVSQQSRSQPHQLQLRVYIALLKRLLPTLVIYLRPASFVCLLK